jgi:hypothetical protein
MKAGPKPRAKARAKAVAPPRAKLKLKLKAKPKPKAPPRAKPRPLPIPTPPPSSTEAKRYKLTAGELRSLAEGHGACIATDQITVGGTPVRFMYRQRAIHDVDSGWRFLSGLESDAYLEDAANLAFYDCNTIANYDRSIVPYLDAPIGSAFEKLPGAAGFTPVTHWSPRD